MVVAAVTKSSTHDFMVVISPANHCSNLALAQETQWSWGKRYKGGGEGEVLVGVEVIYQWGMI